MKERERLALVLLSFGQIEGSKVLRMGVSPFSMISKNSLLDLALAAPYERMAVSFQAPKIQRQQLFLYRNHKVYSNLQESRNGLF